MGSFIELNDTLQVTRAQGFPKDLVYEKHLKKPFLAKDFKGRVFLFKNKKDIRVYQQPPVRNILVENIKGKWLYWGLVQIVEIKHDYVNKLTSGKFRIIHIFSPEEMKNIFESLDRRDEMNYLMTT